MKTKPFDLEAAKAGAPLVTRDGRKARFSAHVPEATLQHRVLAFIEGNTCALSYGEQGFYHSSGPTRDDLFIQVQTKTVYVNLYPANVSHSPMWWHFDTEEQARKMASDDAVAVAIPIEIEI